MSTQFPTAADFTDQQKHLTIKALRDWFTLDTWTTNEALRLLTGIDPHRSEELIFEGKGFRTDENPTWGVLWDRIRLGDELDSNGFPPIVGHYLVPWQLLLLWELLRRWQARPDFASEDRHAPHVWIEFATRNGFPPYWLPWATEDGLHSSARITEPSFPGPSCVNLAWRDAPQPAPAQAPRLLRKADLIAELEKQWPTIRNDITNQTRGELSLKKAAYRELAGKKQGAYDVEAAKQWAEDNLKWKQQTAEAAPPPARKPASAFDGLVARAGKR